MERIFKLRQNGTTVGREVIAGLTTFFAMAYIIAVNPTLLSEAGMEWGAVFLATIIAAVIGTLVMGLVANVPYAQAPAMGLNAFFVYTVCFTFGFTWQQALSMVFICGLINILITVTKIRKYIIKAIPSSLQNAIGGGIGIFVAYIGILNVGIINFDSGVPALAALNQPSLWLFLIGLALTIVLLVCKVKGAILIGIVVTALLGIPMGVTVTANPISFTEACQQLPTTFGAIFTSAGLGSLFTDAAKVPLVLVTIFAFSLSDTFDTIGSFIGTGRRSGIFSEEDERATEVGVADVAVAHAVGMVDEAGDAAEVAAGESLHRLKPVAHPEVGVGGGILSPKAPRALVLDDDEAGPHGFLDEGLRGGEVVGDEAETGGVGAEFPDGFLVGLPVVEEVEVGDT